MEVGGVVIDGPELMAQLSDDELPSGPVLVVSSRGSELAGTIAQALHRKVASVDVTRCEESLFFDG